MTTWLASWRRLLSITGVCFVLFFALLAWRVSAGQDPVLSAQQQSALDSGTQESTTPTTQAS